MPGPPGGSGLLGAGPGELPGSLCVPPAPAPCAPAAGQGPARGDDAARRGRAPALSAGWCAGARGRPAPQSETGAAWAGGLGGRSQGDGSGMPPDTAWFWGSGRGWRGSGRQPGGLAKDSRAGIQGGWRGLGGPEGRLQRVRSLQTVALAWWGSSGPAASPGAPAHMDTMGAWAREGAEGWLSGLGCGPQAGSGSRQWLGPPWPPSLPCLWAKCPDVAQGHPLWLLPRGPPCASVSPLRSEHGDRPVREGGEGVGSGHVCTAEFSGRGQGSRTAEASGRGQGSRMAEASGRGQGSEVLLPPPSAGGR